nr:hypothetical protein 2 [Beihai picorna-like virus 91]
MNEANVVQTMDRTMDSAYTSQNLYRIIDQGLEESVCRDVIVANGEWLSTDEPIGNMSQTQLLDPDYKQPRLITIDLPSAITLGSSFVDSKLSNIAYMRADVDVKLRVQATPFQQGSLWMWNHPYENEVSKQRSHLNEHLRSITSFPGVELNLQHPSRAVELSVPYSSEFQVINHRIGESLSRVTLSVLMPLKSTDDTTRVSYTILAKLKNPQFYGMAPNTNTVKCSIDKVFCCEPLAHDGEDEKASKKGIVSQVADTVGNIADVVSDIPVIGDIAKPVSWIASAVSGVASFFGWSRVRDAEKVSVYSNVPAKGFTHVQGIDQSVVLAACPDNQVDGTVTFSKDDEMAIAYVGQRPFVYGRAVWTVTDDYKSVIGAFPVHPAPYSFSIEVNSRRVYQGPPSALVSSLFRWWRGNMTIRINFAKTSFHQGRLLVQYFPYGSAEAQPVEDVFTSIIDISQVDAEGVSIDIPSVMRNKWYKVNDDDGSPNTDTWTGIVVVSVLNSLIAAPTVAQEVDLYAWVHWNDLELSEPGTVTRVFTPIGDFNKSQINIERIFMPSSTTTVSKSFGRPSYAIGVSSLKSGIDQQYINENEQVFVDFAQSTKTQTVTYKYSADTVGVIRDVPIFDTEVLFITTTPADDINKMKLTTEDIIGNGEVTCDSEFIIYPSNIVLQEFGGLTINAQRVVETSKDSNGLFQMDYTPVVFQAGTYQYVTTSMTIQTRSLGTVTFTPSTLIAHDGLDQNLTTVQDNSHKATTMGEMVVSLRALTRRFTTSGEIDGTVNIEPLQGIGDFQNQRQSLVDIISYLYRFYHGGWRYKFCITSPDLVIVDGAPIPSGQDIDISGAAHIQNTSLNPIVEIEKPFYNPSELLAMSSRTFDNSPIQIRSATKQNLTGFYLKAAADDLNFTFLVGAPAFYR